MWVTWLGPESRRVLCCVHDAPWGYFAQHCELQLQHTSCKRTRLQSGGRDKQFAHSSANSCVLQACTRRTSPSQVVGPACDADCWQACSFLFCLLWHNVGS